MKKSNAFLVFIALVAFTAFAWIGTVKGQSEDTAAYNEYLEKAKSFEEKGIYIDALENYEKAHEFNPEEYSIVLKIADMYYQLGDMNGFIATCDEAIAMSPEDPVPYINKANYYMGEKQYSNAIEVIASVPKSIRDTEEIKNLQIELSTKYIEKYVFVEAIDDWHVQGTSNFVAVEKNGKWGLSTRTGSMKIRYAFEYVGAYDAETGVVPCCYEGFYYYMDLNGNKKLVSDNVYQHLGSFGSGLAPAQRNGQYGYIDTDFNEYKFEFEYAGAFADDVAAVKKNGKWALINKDLTLITEFVYDEILVDSNGFCSQFDVIVACRDGKYIFIDHNGKAIGNSSFDGTALPASNDSYIAVKQGEAWGFADQAGNIVIEPQYEGAKSFSLGLAPIEIADRWGYINTDGTVVIETEYFDAGVFSKDGSAPVKSNAAWNFIVLCEYDD